MFIVIESIWLITQSGNVIHMMINADSSLSFLLVSVFPVRSLYPSFQIASPFPPLFFLSLLDCVAFRLPLTFNLFFFAQSLVRTRWHRVHTPKTERKRTSKEEAEELWKLCRTVDLMYVKRNFWHLLHSVFGSITQRRRQKKFPLDWIIHQFEPKVRKVFQKMSFIICCS